MFNYIGFSDSKLVTLPINTNLNIGLNYGDPIEDFYVYRRLIETISRLDIIFVISCTKSIYEEFIEHTFNYNQ